MTIWRRHGAGLLSLALLTFILAWGVYRVPVREKMDVAQEHLGIAVGPATSDETVGQTFATRHAGLKAVEVLVVRRRPEMAIPPSAIIHLTLERIDEPGHAALVVSAPAANLVHNQSLRFNLPLRPDSRNAAYRLTLRYDGPEEGAELVAYWASPVESYAAGSLLVNGQPADGDLWFKTYYDYGARDALIDGARALAGLVPVVPVLLLVLLLPGLALALWLWPREPVDAGTLAAVALGLSLAFWPLLYTWVDGLGLALNEGWLWGVVALLIAAGVAGILVRGRPRLIPAQDDDGGHLPEVALALILLATVSLRMVQVRDLVVPAWVDSVHHVLLTDVMAQQGTLPQAMEPHFPVSDLIYHFGFHATGAAMSVLGRLPAHRSVLLLGQMLSAAAALAAYVLATRWAKTRWAGVGAALVVGLISYMPAYYASWGRYTHLMGLVLLAPVCIMTVRLLEPVRHSRGLWATAVLLLAGLALTHYRILVFYALFWPGCPALVALRYRGRRGAWRQMIMVAGVLAGLALLATLPWTLPFVGRMLQHMAHVPTGMAAADNLDTSFPVALLRYSWTPYLLAMAVVGGVWAALRRRWELALMLPWVGLWLLVANLWLIGLPQIWLIHSSAAVISLWLPMGALCGWLAADVAGWLDRGARRLWGRLVPGQVLSVVLLAGGLSLGAWGAWRMVDLINPITVLATEADLAAVDWARENLPRDARVLINTRAWQGGIRIGTDAGWWLPSLADRAVTLPCIYCYPGDRANIQAANDLAYAVESAESMDDAALLQTLQQAGITHVFVGAKGGKLGPQEMDSSPHYEMLFASGSTRIYELQLERR